MHPRARHAGPVLIATILVGAFAGASCASAPAPAGAGSTLPLLDSARLIGDVQRLAHDSMAGRATMSAGNAKARTFLAAEYRRLGLEPVGGSFLHPFTMPRRGSADSVRGMNILGIVRGSRDATKVIVVSAHYDHLGTREGTVFNGADDNASGTAAVLAIAAHFRANAPDHTILFALWDAEELGLVGARAFVASPPVRLDRVAVNVNLDMVSRSEQEELYAAGASLYPQVRPLLNALVPLAAVQLRLGHDTGGGREDWTGQSDQGAFHAAKIPFVYFGVEDHPDYHRPTDDPELIHAGFYYRSVRTITAFVVRLDRAVGSWDRRAP